MMGGAASSSQVSPALPSTPGAPADDSGSVLPPTPGSMRDVRRSSMTSSSTAPLLRTAPGSATKNKAHLTSIPGSPDKTPTAEAQASDDVTGFTARRNLTAMFVEGQCILVETFKRWQTYANCVCRSRQAGRKYPPQLSKPTKKLVRGQESTGRRRSNVEPVATPNTR